jgi:hypothetical protein
MLTEDRRVDGEEAREGDVGEQGEAAAGDEPDAQLLGLDPAQLLGQPRLPPVADRPRRLGRPRVRRGRHGWIEITQPKTQTQARAHGDDRFPPRPARDQTHREDYAPYIIGRSPPPNRDFSFSKSSKSLQAEAM